MDEKATFFICNMIVFVKQMHLPRAKREKSREYKSGHGWFGLSPDWLKKRRESFLPITTRNNIKPL